MDLGNAGSNHRNPPLLGGESSSEGPQSMVAVKKRAFEEISGSVPRIGFSPAMVTARAFTGTDPFRSRRRGLLAA